MVHIYSFLNSHVVRFAHVLALAAQKLMFVAGSLIMALYGFSAVFPNRRLLVFSLRSSLTF